ncbi:ATP-dependent helicase HrpB [Vibrio sp. HB161653]|uniref:ATP-dependent helicase HrpB n=1 Tax=Vibrio sp. HB236076 TaxID=3232307 RepID=A0AB39HFM4_9VIBR|nr:ATP-dependent helicase HrpB [Vibrio sp. HB161653]MDP5254022.1 ATP-dependent helicase HrpB [Vibrio sp. HB161653]
MMLYVHHKVFSLSQLPIESVMPQLLTALDQSSQVILKAPPGAGKSTLLPLRLLENNAHQRIIMLEPRRLAAQNIAQFLAKQLNEPIGQTVGYRVRGDSKVSQHTRLQVVTEGVLTRMMQSDPELSDFDLLIFDEFHERHLHGDTALAFALEVQTLRDELTLLVMSATLEYSSLCDVLSEAEYIESQGRQFPVQIDYHPLMANVSLTTAVSQKVQQALARYDDSILVFLPGVAAIKTVAQVLSSSLGTDVHIAPLYGQMSIKDQQAALLPAPKGKRKVVLATNIAETSLTIEAIGGVIDSGLERMAEFDLKSGSTRLKQKRIAQSSAIQRSGRAGRLQAGWCWRLYSEAQFRQQALVPEPEILRSDLAPLVMELSQWGVNEVCELAWLDEPKASSIAQAKTLLSDLGLLTDTGLTELGRLAYPYPCHPRLAAMLVKAEASLRPTAALIVALLEERETKGDLCFWVRLWCEAKHPQQQRVSKTAERFLSQGERMSSQQIELDQVPALLCLAYPDRIAQVRASSMNYLLANGHGGHFSDHSSFLNREDYLVAIDLRHSDGQSSSQILCYVELGLNVIEETMARLIEQREWVDIDDKTGTIKAHLQTRYQTLVLAQVPIVNPEPEKMTQALLNYVHRHRLSCLNWHESVQQWVTRIRCAEQWLPEYPWPDVSEAALLASTELWLLPELHQCKSVKGLKQIDLVKALTRLLPWPLPQILDNELPTHYRVATGQVHPIRYVEAQSPILSVRMQQMFGERQSPTIAQARVTLTVELLSPANRPLQLTQDLASFWQNGYQAVKKEMKGRYPKHVWPDDPAQHQPTTKTKKQLNS